mmetsp:Transcript_47502/g.75111  ORF Transcript_47502/g.75111 Transcript_47502/m.75111 type:complete len:166 (-) Transcript_47502:170-667(-)
MQLPKLQKAEGFVEYHADATMYGCSHASDDEEMLMMHWLLRSSRSEAWSFSGWGFEVVVIVMNWGAACHRTASLLRAPISVSIARMRAFHVGSLVLGSDDVTHWESFEARRLEVTFGTDIIVNDWASLRSFENFPEKASLCGGAREPRVVLDSMPDESAFLLQHL